MAKYSVSSRKSMLLVGLFNSTAGYVLNLPDNLSTNPTLALVQEIKVKSTAANVHSIAFYQFPTHV